jgi:hypothetical protein
MWVGVFGIHEWRIGLLPDDGQAESYRIVCRISSYKRASIEESSRSTFFRIPAAMPTYRDESARLGGFLKQIGVM